MAQPLSTASYGDMRLQNLKGLITQRVRELSTKVEVIEITFGVTIQISQHSERESRSLEFWLNEVMKSMDEVTKRVESLEAMDTNWQARILAEQDISISDQMGKEREQHLEDKSYFSIMAKAHQAKALLLQRRKEIDERFSKMHAPTQHLLQQSASQSASDHAFANPITQPAPIATATAPHRRLQPLPPSNEPHARSPVYQNQSSSNLQRLPRISLPKFSSGCKEFLAFWDAFKVHVHNQELDKTTKMAYLQECIQGEAKEWLSDIPPIGEEYEVAVDMLKQRYGSRQTLLTALYSDLQNIQQAGESARECDLVYCKTKAVLAQLRRMGDACQSGHLNELILLRFPADFRFEVKKELIKQYGRDLIWELDSVMSVIQSQLDLVRLREETHAGLSLSSPSKAIYAAHKEREQPLQSRERSPQWKARNTDKCAFCNRTNHKSYKCDHTTPQDKEKIARRMGLCFRCFGRHFSSDCTAQNVPQCECGFNHNPVMCTQGNRRRSPSRERRRRGNDHEPRSPWRPSNRETQLQRSSSRESRTRRRSSDYRHRPPTPGRFGRQVHVVQSNTLMGECEEIEDEHSKRSESRSPIPTLNTYNVHAHRSSVSLMTCRVSVLNSEGQPVSTSILIDPGSEISFISNKLVEKLHLRRQDSAGFTIKVFGSYQAHKSQQKSVEIALVDCDGHAVRCELECYDNLPRAIQTAQITERDKLFIHNHDLRIADSESNGQLCDPEIMLGMDYYFEFCHMQDKPVVSMPSGMKLVPSIFGWLVAGKNEIKSRKETKIRVFNVIKDRMKDYWSLELLGIKDEMVPAAVQPFDLEKYLKKDVVFREGIPYFRLPWKKDRDPLPNGYGMARMRLDAVFKLSESKPKAWEKYVETIQQYKELGIIETANNRIPSSFPEFYLPHHPVFTPEKSTTIRVVFDGAAHLKGHPSLNDCLHTGLDLLPSLIGMLLRYRCAKFVANADVEKAYLQLRLVEDQKDSLRFLFLKDPSLPPSNENVEVFRFTRIPFGLTSSPFILALATICHLRQVGVESLKGLESNIYVDNVALGSEDELRLLKDCESAKKVFGQLKMNLRDFRSNSSLVNDGIERRGLGLNFKEQQKFLGIVWNTGTDEMSFHGLPKLQRKLTRRNVVSHVSSLFDPLGLICPLYVLMKKFTQKLSQVSSEWDKELSAELAEEWKSIETSANLSSISLSRRFSISDPSRSVELCLFTDASTIAYAAVTYIRAKDRRGFRTSLAMAKSRLTPSAGKTTIPRLELLGIVIGVNLIEFLAKQLKGALKIDRVRIFSDSTIALNWLFKEQSPDRFVRNQVNRMREKVSNVDIPVSFHYVPSESNPADRATRGMRGNELNDQFWWKGPEWLRKDDEQWPNQIQTSFRPTEDFLASKPELVAYSLVVQEEPKPFVFPDSEMTTFLRMKLRAAIIGRILRTFVYDRLKISQSERSITLVIRLRQALPGIELFQPLSNKVFNPINGSELREGVNFLLRDHQNRFISQSLARYSNLLPYQDDKKIWRSRGRLGKAEVPDFTKFPAIIAANSEFCKLLIRNAHEEALHAGVNHTLSKLRERYWCSRGRQAVRKFIRSCTRCQRYNARAFRYPTMADLPSRRVVQSSPFEHCGLDHLGPLKVLQNNGKELKVWILIVTCLATRLIHLETVLSLDIHSFLFSLRRFFSHWRVPLSITCDNAPTFHMASNVLSAITQKEPVEWNSFLQSKEIEWIFNTPRAPWKGGVYERLVASVKSALFKTLGNHTIKHDEFNTVVKEIAACLNSRPLTYVGEEQVRILRPIDFQFPNIEICSMINTGVTENDNRYVPNRPTELSRELAIQTWQRACRWVNEFWTKWLKEYVIGLRESHREQMMNQGGKTKREPRVGEIVIMHDEAPRGRWPLGKITQIFRSEDGHVRSAELLLGNHVRVKRPVNLLIPLELFSDESENPNRTEIKTPPREAPLRRSTRNHTVVNYREPEVDDAELDD